MEDDYEEALAKALELSRMDHQQSQRASANPPDQSGQPSSSTQRPPINLENTGREGREYARNQEDDPKVTGEDLKQQDACREGLAIPLCLPNNYKWNKHTGECIKIGEERSSLYVIEEALNQLNTIKGKSLSFFYLGSLTTNQVQSPAIPGHILNFEDGNGSGQFRR